MERILIGTKSLGKMSQYRDTLKELELDQKFEFINLKDFVSPASPIEVREDAFTFEENAVKKAVAYGRRYMMSCISDATGLVVPALGNRPGVHSDRDGYSPKRVLDDLDRMPAGTERRARMVTSMAFYDPGLDSFISVTDFRDGTIARRRDWVKTAFGYEGIFCLEGKTIARYLRTGYQRGCKFSRLRVGVPRATCLALLLERIQNKDGLIHA